MMNSLDLFDPMTACWFERALGTPTAVQDAAWPAIADGKHTLVSAPTGTGKTLSAFLVFIDRLKAMARQGSLRKELYLIYVSPLKSLAGDIRENLNRPLQGICEEEYLSGYEAAGAHNLNVKIRTGDTSQKDRRAMIKTPPHILIITPESLYLMMSSKSGQGILKTARAIIIDELHAMIDSKRGAHLMLTIARLDRLCPNPLQRIGLSATIEPLRKAAEYLAPEEVVIVAPRMHKVIQIQVTSPLNDPNMPRKDPVWQELAQMVYDYCLHTKSVITFVEGRAYAEKLAYFINQIAGEGFARTHHGSLSKEQRFLAEQALREGRLRLLVATSSMELGIDVGDIEQVFQIGCPRSISSTMQRLGRAGHNPNRTSVMHIFPRMASEALYSGLTAEVARKGGIEYSQPPRLCLDVLAQHLVSMATGEGYDLEEVMRILARAYPFYEVTLQDVREVLCMLAGDYEHDRNIPVRPRVLYDRIHDRVEGDSYSRMLAISTGGTIPDKGLYTVKTETGVKLGELDEEFIFESRVGDRFLLGTFAWQISSIQKDAVIVKEAARGGARLPFWKGDIKGRRLKTGLAFGALLRDLSKAEEEGRLFEALQGLGLNDTAAKGAGEFVQRQLNVTKRLPDDRTIVIEHLKDETGNWQMMVHSVFGRQVNAPLGILVQELAKRRLRTNINLVEDDDGFLLFPYGGCELPEGLLQQVEPGSVRPILTALLPSTPIFHMTFRYNTARALMMGVRKSGRQPLWVQRLRSAEMLDSLLKYGNHPLIRETKRECLEDYWDLDGVEYVLNGIRSGSIQIQELHTSVPSPMSFLLRQQTEASMMYEYAPIPNSIHHATEEALQQVQMIAPAPEQLAKVSERGRLPEDEKQLHSLLMTEGDLIAGELKVPIDWLEILASQGRAKYIEPGLWIAAEHEDRYCNALIEHNLEEQQHIVLRALRYRGATTIEQLSERYLWDEPLTKKILDRLCLEGEAIEYEGIYYHATLYDRARRETIKDRRKQITTQPAQNYAAILARRVRITAPAKEQLEYAIRLLLDQPYPVAYWESILLPIRVGGYRPELLDSILAGGNIIYRQSSELGLSFHQSEDIDWDADLAELSSRLEGDERTIFEALMKRGASFLQRLNDLLGGVSPHDTLLRLVDKGYVASDSFMPIRQLQNKELLNKASVRQRVNARVKALNDGRFEVARPLLEHSIEEQLDRIFDRFILVCKETTQGISWEKALECLRVWEYTGRVRRGYFVEGLSGIQFLRDKDYAGITKELEDPGDDILWISAIDPAQPWGKRLPHLPERAFMNLPGTLVALRGGNPVAVMERQGKVLRCFDFNYITEVLQVFVQDYSKRRVYPTVNRIIVKEYPQEAVKALSAAGFLRELQDYAIYR